VNTENNPSNELRMEYSDSIENNLIEHNFADGSSLVIEELGDNHFSMQFNSKHEGNMIAITYSEALGLMELAREWTNPYEHRNNSYSVDSYADKDFFVKMAVLRVQNYIAPEGNGYYSPEAAPIMLEYLNRKLGEQPQPEVQ